MSASGPALFQNMRRLASRTGGVLVRHLHAQRSDIPQWQHLPVHGHHIRAESLAGVYADPEGGKVHFVVDGPAFTMVHSLLGQVPGTGRIESHLLRFGSHSAVFDGQHICWDNGIVAEKLIGEEDRQDQPREAPTRQTEPRCSVTASQPDVASGLMRSSAADPVHRILWTQATVPFDEESPMAHLRDFAAWLSNRFDLPHVRGKSRAVLSTRLEKLLRGEGMLIEAQSYLATLRSRDEVIAGFVHMLSFTSRFPYDPYYPPVSEDMSTCLVGARNLHNILRFDFLRCAHLLDMVGYGDVPDCIESLQAWAQFSTGRSLFISGLGVFDINEAKDHLVEKEAIPSPASLQAIGYAPRLFPTAPDEFAWMDDEFFPLTQMRDLFRLNANDFRFRYFVRHHRWFNDDIHINRLDEVLQLPDRDDELPPGLSLDIGPRRMLDALQDTRREQVQPFVRFEWLLSLSERKCSLGVLVPLRDSHDVLRVGKELRNCAADYICQVQQQRCVLVVLREQVNGKTLALGEFDGRRFKQLVESCNLSASKDVRECFDDYLPDIRMWWKQR